MTIFIAPQLDHREKAVGNPLDVPLYPGQQVFQRFSHGKLPRAGNIHFGWSARWQPEVASCDVNPVYATDPTKWHISHVVADPGSWQQKFDC